MLLSGITLKKNRRSPAAVNRLLETHIPTLFHAASTLSAPSGHLPLEWKATFVRIVFLHVSCIRFDDARKAAFSFRSLPHYYENISRLKNGAKSSPL